MEVDVMFNSAKLGARTVWMKQKYSSNRAPIVLHADLLPGVGVQDYIVHHGGKLALSPKKAKNRLILGEGKGKGLERGWGWEGRERGQENNAFKHQQLADLLSIH
jgi:hypothetical protein